MEKSVALCGEDFDRLLSLVGRLRGDHGCPWDRVQRPEDVQTYLIEEAYEVLHALDRGNPGEVCAELGDLLFQIAFLARIFEERGAFTMGDVLQGITAKMIRRHPHVFGTKEVSSAEEVRQVWHEVKRDEAKVKSDSRASCLDSVPEKLPALMRAYRLGKRASRFGFDWPNTERVFVKVEGELAALKDAVKRDDREKAVEAFGHLLFATVHMSRFIGIHPERALTQDISRFIKGFKDIEESLRRQGRTMDSVSAEEMADMWDVYERNERA